MILLTLLVLVVGGILNPGPMITPRASASAPPSTSCYMDNLTPHSVNVGNDTGFSMQVGSDTVTIRWIRVTVPASNVAIFDASSPDFHSSITTSQATFSQGTLAQGNLTDLYIAAHIGAYVSPGSWKIEASPNSDGSGAVTCSGDTSITFNGTAPTLTISGISASVSGTSATITWQTNSPANSTVVYGTTLAYGSQQGSSAFVTLHRITLSGLRLSTGYHFKVLSEDVNNTSATSADNTFLTPAATTTTTAQKTSSSSAPLTKITIKHTETIPPTIQLSKIGGAYKHAPLLTGSADDNSGIAAVEYSLDGGVNWLPVDSLAGAGAKHVTYSFTPVVPQDGNYEVVARATDTSGNKTSTSVQTLIIDRLPPLVGGNILSVGPQLIEPDSDGTIRAQQGVDQTITMSAIGGATSITLEAVAGAVPAAGSRQYSESFNLTYSTDTGLWSGVASFGRPGRYSLTAIAVDGAGNKTTRQLNTVNVSPPGHILSSSSRKALDAQVSVYYLEPETNAWVVWDAAAYGQQNPQHTRPDGSFMLYLPAGKYYLKAKARGYHDYVSSIFTLKRVTPVTANLLLKPMRGPSIAGHYLSLPNLSTDRLPFMNEQQAPISHNNLLGKAAPDFALLSSSGDTVHFAQLLGRPTVLVMDSLWSPTGTEQLSALTKLQADQDINIYPVALQEGLGKVQASMAIAGSPLIWLVDPDSNITASYGVKSLPTTYFLDRSGIVRDVETGPLNQTQIMEIVSRL